MNIAGSTFPHSLVRTNPFPLDASSVFATLEDAREYAKNDGEISFCPYQGQIITVLQGDKENIEDNTLLMLIPWEIAEKDAYIQSVGTFKHTERPHYALTPINSYFNLVTINGEKVLHTKYPLYSDKWISALGANSEAKGGGGAELFIDWNKYDSSTASSLALGANLGYGLKADIGTLQNKISVLEKSVLGHKIETTGTGNFVKSIVESEDKKKLTVTLGNIPTASATALGAVKIGANITITDGVISTHNPYTLPTASSSVKGGVKIGTGLAINNELLSLTASGVKAGTYAKVTVDIYGRVTGNTQLAAADIPNLSWSKITSDKPTTLAGYGISDAYTKTQIDTTIAKYLPLSGGTMTGAISFTPKDTSDIAPQIFSEVTGSQTVLVFKAADDTNDGFIFRNKYYNNEAETNTLTILYGGITANTNVKAPTFTAETSVKIGDATISWDATNKALKINTGIYSDSWISALGANSEAKGGGAELLTDWSKYSSSTAASLALGANLGWGLKNDIGTLQSKVTTLESGSATTITTMGEGNVITTINKNGNAITATKGITALTNITKAMVEGVLTGNISSHTHSQYLTSHQSLTSYLTKSDASTLYQPKGSYLTTHQSLTSYLTKTDAAATYQPKGNYLTSHQSLTNYATKSDIANFITEEQADGWYLLKSSISSWALATSKPSYSWSEITNKPSSMPASDVYAWAKAATKPSYTASEVGALPIDGGTLTGNLRIKDGSNYGMKLNFGDGDYVYLKEDTDDHLTIHADKGVNILDELTLGNKLNVDGNIKIGVGKCISHKPDDVLAEGRPFYGMGFFQSSGLTKLHIGGYYGIEINCYEGNAIHANCGFYSDSYVSAQGQNTTSDARLKDIIGAVRLTTEEIAHAPSVAFRWRKDGTKAIGTIAQYWKKITPLAVHEVDNHLAMQYDVIALLASISNAKTLLNHEERIKALEEENRELKRQIKLIA